jgi:nitrite transporter NirC
VDENGELAETKATQVRRLSKFLLSSAFAGAFVGVAVVLLIAVSAPLVADGSPAAKLVQGAVFGIALTLVVFAGAELFTGNVMVMLQGLSRRTVGVGALLAVWVASLVGNVVGSIVFAAMVHGSGTFSTGAPAKLVASMVEAKRMVPGPQLFWRAVLCNLLVCLALWMAARTRSDAAKLVVLWWALFAFIAAGYEHSIANATTFALGVFEGSASWSDLAFNLAWTVPGNIVGGGLLVGVAYAWLGRPARVTPTVAVDVPTDDPAVTPIPTDLAPVG